MSFVRRVLCVLPVTLAVTLGVLDPVLGRLLLPYRELLLALLSLQLLICFALIRRQGTRRILQTFAIAAIAAAGIAVVVVREYEVSERRLAFDSNGATLVGTLYASNEKGPHPALVVVHGSGKFPRRVYRYWGQEFARLGFDVLVYDKRGVGDSGGAYEGENNTSDENLRRLAGDAANAVDVVASLPGVTPHIGLFGVSQGGWIAPLAAQMNPKVKFLVLHSGPVVSVGQQNLYSEWTGGGHRSGSVSIDDAEQRLASKRPAGFDPRETLAGLSVRSLWLFGGDDRLVPVRSSIGNLQALIADGKTFEYRLLPAADHLILTKSTRFSSAESAEYWSSITGWMEENQHRRL